MVEYQAVPHPPNQSKGVGGDPPTHLLHTGGAEGVKMQEVEAGCFLLHYTDGQNSQDHKKIQPLLHYISPISTTDYLQNRNVDEPWI